VDSVVVKSASAVVKMMQTRAAVAVFDAEASNKIVTGKVTSDRSMSRPFPAYASTDLIGTTGALATLWVNLNLR
jgi:hypothetical protein